jgi:ceramide glucosyltransferase
MAGRGSGGGRGGIAGAIVKLLLIGVCADALAYQAAAILAVLRHLARRDPRPTRLPPVSILKPVRGRDPRFYEAIRTHAEQSYPEFEMLFGIADPGDPAAGDIRRLQREYPDRAIRLIVSRTEAPNGKAGVLIDLAAEARYELFLVNDSDIHVPAGYLRDLVAPLEDPGVGLVTCLYRADADGLPGIWEALGIVTDFAPSTLVAPMAGVKEFGLGSTLLFRRADLDAIGGFAALAAYIADDYQLGRRITRLGRRVHLSRVVVETALGGRWRDVWRHQVRWARTIRVSRAAYAGLPVTSATLWAVIAFAAGLTGWAAALLAIRMAMAVLAGWGLLRSQLVWRYALLIPLRDLWGVAVWMVGLFGSRIQWRDRMLTLRPDGTIGP